MFRLFFLMVALHFAASSAHSQTDSPAVPAAAATSKRDAQPPSFASSLLLIEADWSNSPSSKEIAAELRDLLRNEPVAADRLQALPSSGASILFPPETASIYTREHYAAFLAWLKLKGLLLESEPFSIGEFEARMPRADGQTDRYSYQVNTLEKTLDFLGLTLPAPSVDQPLATRRIALTWSIQNSVIADGSQPSSRLDFTRTVRTSEKPRGEERYIDGGLNDECSFHRQPLKSGEVLIVQAFPSSDDRVFRLAAAQKGFLALIAIEGDFPGSAPGPDARLLLPHKVERLPVHKSKSAGSELMIDQRHPPTSSRYMISKEVMISWSEAKHMARGFSTPLGKWAEQKIDPPATDTLPGVSEDTAVWRVGNAYYAFSGETARWDVLRLPDDHSPSDATFESGFVRVHDGDDVYIFATATGRWSSSKDDQSVTASKPDAVIKVFTLRNTQAIDAERLITQLFPRDIQSVAADQRTNSLIVRGGEEILTIIYHILMRLDEPPQSAPSSPAARDVRQQAAVSASVEKLTAQYQSEERKAADLARQIRELQPAPEAHKQAIDELTTKLRRAVADAFAARQQLQQAEAIQLQQRLAGIRQNLETRQKLSEQVIDHRVKDLLNPDVQWEWESDGVPRLVGQASRLPGSPVPTSSPAPSPRASAPTPSAPNLPAARAYRDKLGERWNAIEQLFQGGRVPPSEVLQAATEFAQAERDASANAEERWAARRQAVDRLKAIKAIIDTKFEQGSEPSQNKLAVDAYALIKAESELAAESQNKRSFEPVPVHWQSRQMDQIIWNVLGVRLQEIVPQSGARFGYKGGLLVDEVRTDPQPSELRDGDIVFGLHHWETTQREHLAWVLMQPISKNVAILNPRDRTSTETAVIRILRDGQPLQFEIKLPPPMVELNRANVPGGASSSPAAKNALPKAAETGSSSSSPASTITIGASGDLTTLRAPDDFRRRLATGAASVERLKTLAQRGRDGQTEDARAESLETIERAERDLAFLRQEYAAQLRLLELELQDAESAVSSASQQREETLQEFRSGRAKRDNTIAAERALQEAQIRLHRAKTLLDLYRKADPKPSAGEATPQNTPASSPT